MLISSFLDCQWLLYIQPVMSEENTAHAGVRVTLNAVKRDSRLSKLAAVKGTVLKAYFTEQIAVPINNFSGL